MEVGGFECKECHKTYTRKSSLTRHWNRKHLREPLNEIGTLISGIRQRGNRKKYFFEILVNNGEHLHSDEEGHAPETNNEIEIPSEIT